MSEVCLFALVYTGVLDHLMLKVIEVSGDCKKR